ALTSCSLQRAWPGKGGRGKAEEELTRNYLQWFIVAMKGFPQMNRLNIFFGRNAVRLLGVFFFVSLLTPRHFAAGETVRFAGDSESKFQYCLPVVHAVPCKEHRADGTAVSTPAHSTCAARESA